MLEHRATAIVVILQVRATAMQLLCIEICFYRVNHPKYSKWLIIHLCTYLLCPK